ncbi:hypothetical protein CHM34_10545 [Paludifilum halophilum]|uniref:Uncharacterized protein n=1 Tax=Paludifilum halophilum TaxID=1642702 RepID=A0A235B4X5_9BACL|nr:hypothetical protein CHM34_10545 [Paludifilum halophilum]
MDESGLQVISSCPMGLPDIGNFFMLQKIKRNSEDHQRRNEAPGPKSDPIHNCTGGAAVE